MNIAIGCDHAGYLLKDKIKNHFSHHDFIDFGCNSSESVDYPDFAHGVSEAIESKNAELGILICGSGNGINMAANKHQGIRSALSWAPEIAELARLHNNANIVALPARFIDEKLAIEIVDKFLTTDFEGGRHERRVNKIQVSD